jgi:hypothetical protein
MKQRDVREDLASCISHIEGQDETANIASASLTGKQGPS